MNNNGGTKRAYLAPGAKVAVRTGNIGRPPTGTLAKNLYDRTATLCARVVRVGRNTLIVGRHQVRRVG